MKKFRIYYDKDKETEWLNEMAAQGYAMTSFFAGFYHFDTCTPGKYTYQIDFSDRPFAISEDYREFMKDNNIEIVQTWGLWIMLRKRTADGPFYLYTDIDSSIEHYTKIRNMFKGASILMILCFFVECFCAMNAPLCILFVFLIGVFMFSIINATLKTNRIITKLMEEKGEPSKTNNGLSPFLITGLLFNAGILMIERPEPIAILLRIIAIALMVYGIVKTFSKDN